MRFALPIMAMILFLHAGIALAASKPPRGDLRRQGEERYGRCLALAQSRPQAAFDAALAWHDEGGGAAAAHCAAVALVGLGHYAEAALKLDALARDPAAGETANRAAILDQAGNAWLLAGQPEKAFMSFSGALKLTPADVDILSDRARAKAMRKDWAGADADLTAALVRDPNRPELLVLRASARRAEGRPHEAWADVEEALRLRPNFAEALVERGAIKFDAGDKAGARADWQKVLRQAGDSPAGDSARKHIEQLDFNAPARAR